MTTVLIVDACKPSLVMTSEIFKDKMSGTIVDVAQSGKETLEYLNDKKPDLCVIDFDLPDVDGPALVEAMRKVFQGPILMTAYPERMVEEAVSDHLFAFNDASAWVSKPIKSEELEQKIDKFLLDGYRLGKRFASDMETQLVGKAAGRGKRAPKASGRIINLSLGGAKVKLEGALKVKKSQELTLTLALPVADPRKGGSRVAAGETKIKATIAWTNTSQGELGLKFLRLTEVQKRGLENFFRDKQPV
ncbi:response regulator [Pseudobacteriovorax antillogorgiicola]|uniref:PilZ domain-containing protein n=1 Tax=Pseudobacteriovorax antillogorgiicola TaxID=1513793 RepID=A0A1Y6CBA3_9BACT|nr:response regulator [Pseudobacteriovorax antillogorgiicola]TCS49459.1 PilZ domain-containing protein [Pseudobacteriovorax antillogorgiicola]SMF46379.1 PilZ domain-containing protein [Pseudobacteriovorax antillogorgiicola]